MRPIVLSVCLLAAACGRQGPQSPLSPTSLSTAVIGSSQTQSQGGNGIPFRGSFTRSTSFPEGQSCPPPAEFTINGTEAGTGTHLGAFTATSVDFVGPLGGVGTWDFTAANGDRLFSETVGVENSFEPPIISRVTLRARVSFPVK